MGVAVGHGTVEHGGKELKSYIPAITPFTISITCEEVTPYTTFIVSVKGTDVV